jgi:HPt (histidine-containing phosphotransfer) domain-containing protein
VLREVVGEAFSDITASFLADTRSHIDQIEAALAASDAERVRSAAHQLKSSSASLGALTLSGAMKSIEQDAARAELSQVRERLEVAVRERARIEAYFALSDGS